MGFEDIISELRKDSEEEYKKIIAIAEESSEAIVKEAHAKAKEYLKNAKNEANSISEREYLEKITSARLAAKKILDEAKNQAVEYVIDEIWQKYKKEALSSSRYPALLNRLIKEGIDELGASGEPITVYVREEDKKLLPHGYRVLRLPPEYSGGAIVESHDGKISVNKTLEEIFSSKRHMLRKQIYQKLF